MKEASVINMLVSLVVVVLIASAVMPALGVVQRSVPEAKCQANLRRWAQAMALYTDDWSRHYPANGIILANDCYARRTEVQLSIDSKGDVMLDADGNPVRFVYGINWVEALYPYVIKYAKETSQDWESFMKCPNALQAGMTGSIDPGTARMSYAMNYNLLEKSTSVVCNPDKVMMFREMDRLFHSVCRPTVTQMGGVGSSTAIYNAFLGSSSTDGTGMPYPPLNPTLHGNGSYIVFTDGHIHWFDLSYFSPLPYVDPASSNSLQYWNYINNQENPEVNKTIAITPY